MKSTDRRSFLQASAAAVAGVTLGPGASLGTGLATAPALRAAASERLAARPVPLERVRITGGPLQRAQQADIKYLLELEPDRMLAFYRLRAGLPAKASPYGGWDGPGRNLTGHVAGHYLSAVSLMYAATGDARFRDRATYLVRELAAVQAKNGDGYLSALDGGREAFSALSRGEIRSAAFDLNGLWSPWYTLHKTFAGLRDAYRHTGNHAALEVERGFAAWAGRTLAPLNDAQLAKMLNTEHGGMNEVLADLYADTSEARWLALSRRFEHHAFTDALARHQDNLPGKHVNCQIPKLIGSAARYAYTGDGRDLVTAAFFWDRVAQHHSYATGGQGLDEYFGFPDELSRRVDGRACESCCVYNMLKLTRRLFSFRPDVFYADVHERMLFNHALASFDPDGVRMSYMVPVGRAEQQEYQRMFEDFTCCMGTGMENHALHGEGIYFESPDTVWVNLFVPSTAELRNGARIETATDFPDGERATITFSGRPVRPFTMAIRRPGWAGDGFAVSVNGERLAVPSVASLRVGGAGGRDLGLDDATLPPSSYITIERLWRSADTVSLTIPKALRLEPTPDDATIAAVMWGPLVLAADLGPRRERSERPPRITGPVLVSDGRRIEEWMAPSAARQGDFQARGIARRLQEPNDPVSDVAFTPFYRTHGRTYGVYHDVLTTSQFDARVAAEKREAGQLQTLERATIAYARPGQSADEETFHYRSDPSNRPITHTDERTGRGGLGWFSFEMPVAANVAQFLVVTYHNDLGLPVLANFTIEADGAPLARYVPNRSATAFWDAVYPLPAAMVAGRQAITVRFVAGSESRIVPIYGVRIATEWHDGR